MEKFGWKPADTPPDDARTVLIFWETEKGNRTAVGWYNNYWKKWYRIRYKTDRQSEGRNPVIDNVKFWSEIPHPELNM